MRYAVISDIHANLEALEAVLAKIDELAQEEPIDQIWFLGDLVGYGSDPNDCIVKLRDRTDIIIAGNHDWAAVGKIDLEDFSAAARISAEWTAEQLTEEHRAFLANLPERLEFGECTLVHGSPYGPLWEYLTSEILAERSFQYFNTRYCFVGHTHMPLIFQQSDAVANTPTLPLESNRPGATHPSQSNGIEPHTDDTADETSETVAVHPPAQQSTPSKQTADSAIIPFMEPESEQNATEHEASAIIEEQMQTPAETPLVVEVTEEIDDSPATENLTSSERESNSTPAGSTVEDATSIDEGGSAKAGSEESSAKEPGTTQEEAATPYDHDTTQAVHSLNDEDASQETETPHATELENDDDYTNNDKDAEQSGEIMHEIIIASAEDQLGNEIQELLTLLGLSQSMITVTNEMITPPEGHWEAPAGYRAIINPGGVGQPRDGDPRAAFMIYDTERGFAFYRVAYPLEKTQEKIIKAGLPHYLAVRLAYGR
jgi:diadenosine tetraphosphatase ApaH/serine/threonine PP2A family protein phosphatase